MRVGILGLGLIGGSLLRRLATEEDVEVSGWDGDPDVRAAVMADGYTVARSEAALSEHADLVIVALPPRATAPAVLRALATSDHVLVADVASVKAPVVEAVRAGADLASLHRFVPAHPLAGAEEAGWGASRAELLDHAVWAICPPSPDAPVEPVAVVAGALGRLGARLAFCTAEEHDAAVARSSHAPHVVAQTLALATDTPLAAVLSGGALRDGTRVAGANPELWMEVLGANAAAIADSLGRIVDLLEHTRSELLDAAVTDTAAMWRTAGESRRRIDALRWREGPWTSQRMAPPALEPLLAFGRRGQLIRRLTRTDAGWAFELEVTA